MAGTLEGLPIIDATEPLHLLVKNQDIRKRGSRGPAVCALAECVKRQTGHDVRVYLSRAYILNDDGDAWVRYEVSQIARREIVAFDRGAPFQPGIYVLNRPRGNREPRARTERTGNGSIGSGSIKLQRTVNIRPVSPAKHNPRKTAPKKV